MKRFPIRAMLVTVIVLLMNGCASNGVVTEAPTTQTGGSVPGETIPDEGRLAPAPGANPNAGMRW